MAVEAAGFFLIMTTTDRRTAVPISVNLVASLMQGLMGLALIPIATFVLGPKDYGIYGMAVVTLTLVAALCETGSAYVLYGSYQSLSKLERGHLQSTLLFFALLLGLIAATLLILCWSALYRFVPLLSDLTGLELLLLCSTLPLKTTWAIINPILIVQQRSNWLAASVLIQSTTTFIVVLIFLYLLSAGRTALFWGQFIGLLACVLASLVKLRHSAFMPLKLKWLRHLRSVALGAWFAGVVYNIREALESALIVKTAGGDALGNYAHARLYQGFMTQGTNAFANVLWPVALKEAKMSKNSAFSQINSVWNVVYAGLTCFGVGAALLGHELVDLLTHGKFFDAAAWLPWLVIYVLIQNAGKPATAAIYAADKSNLYSGIRIVTLIAASAALLLLVPNYGVPAVLFVLILEMVTTRILIAFAARRVSTVPFQDQWVISGTILIIFCAGTSYSFDLSLSNRCIAFVGISLVVISILLISKRSTINRNCRRLQHHH